MLKIKTKKNAMTYSVKAIILQFTFFLEEEEKKVHRVPKLHLLLYLSCAAAGTVFS